MNRFWERVMLALVVCIPVPALALSGLNIPLPSVVERVAAALVPFASAATIDDGATLASGRIVQASEAPVTRSSTGTPHARTVRVVRVAKPAQPAPPKPTFVRPKAAPVVVAAAVPPATLGADTPVAAAESPAPSADPPAPTPDPAPEPTPTPTPTREPNPPIRPIAATPVEPDVKPLPEDTTGPPPPEPDVKPVEPVYEVQPEPTPEPPKPAPEPPKREQRTGNHFESNISGA